MGIRVRGSKKNIVTAEMILEATIGRLDPYNQPFEIITLKYTPKKRMSHKGKTHGFEDCIISRNTQSGQISIKYRKSGSAEWLKDRVGGDYVAKIPKTEHNLQALACNHYDGLWTIQEPHIREVIKEMADAIDEECKKVKCPYLEDGTWYDYNKSKREAHFHDGRRFNISLKGATKVAEEQVILEEAKLAKRRIKIEREEAELKEREEKHKKASIQIPPVPKVPLPETAKAAKYTKEGLVKMNVMTLKKKAKQEFGIENAFSLKKEVLIPMVLEQQDVPLIAPEVSNELETEIVTS